MTIFNISACAAVLADSLTDPVLHETNEGKVTLEAEPDNVYDCNAVKVKVGLAQVNPFAFVLYFCSA